MKHNFTCALFDVDGTLVDSSDAHGYAWERAFKKFGFDVSFKQIKEDIGMGGKEIVNKHLSRKDAKAFSNKISEFEVELFTRELLKGIKPFPYAERLIKHLSKRGVKIILASSTPTELVENYINLLKISKVILGYVSGSDVVRAKPAPDIFEKALSKCSVSKKGTVVIGDSPYDVVAARRAHLPAIAILSGGFKREEVKGAIHIFSTLKELYEYVDELFIKPKTIR